MKGFKLSIVTHVQVEQNDVNGLGGHQPAQFVERRGVEHRQLGMSFHTTRDEEVVDDIIVDMGDPHLSWNGLRMHAAPWATSRIGFAPRSGRETVAKP